MGGGERKRTVKLFCPSLSKIVPLVAWDDQRLDLGSIARAFGLDPATLKLNGHFISRGLDLVASSVTWKSLLSFFSARGLSTGASDSDALIVDGKFSKLGTKRVQEPAGVENAICYAQLEDEDLFKSKKFKESSSGCIDPYHKVGACDGFGLKRKQHLEDVSPLKRLRMKGPVIDMVHLPKQKKMGFREQSQTIFSGAVKRIREAEFTASRKKTRL